MKFHWAYESEEPSPGVKVKLLGKVRSLETRLLCDSRGEEHEADCIEAVACHHNPLSGYDGGLQIGE